MRLASPGYTPLPRAVAAALLLIALWCAFESYRMGLWTFGQPGVGLLPFGASLLLIPISIVLILRVPPSQESMQLHPVALVTGLGFCLFVAAVAYLGLVVPTMVFTFCWSYWLYGRSLRNALLAAPLMALFMWTVFKLVFSLPIQTWPV
jgi:hypothetical protein